MPLPRDNETWPPKPLRPALDLMETHDAWYLGDPAVLTGIYRGEKYQNHASQYRGGLVGFVARLWWGKPAKDGEARMKLHLPLPADIATMSADLLFSEPPRVVIPDASKTSTDGTIVESEEQKAIEQVVNTAEVFTTLLEAAEIAAALGGSYLRLIWDKDRMEHVRPEVIHADNAVPTFRFGVLQDVLFWTDVSEPGDDHKLRWVELHEPGKITHALYQGNGDELGYRVPLDRSPHTEWLASMNGDGVQRGDDNTVVLTTGVKGLTACYVPNMLPNRIFRKNATLAPFGRSDYSGLEPAFDAIDEAFTSWARDVRLAKARIIVPNQYLESMGPGQGARFDTEQEVYEGLDFLTTDTGSKSINPQQFKIRVQEHERTITEWTRYVLRGAGYSPSSLGEQGTGTQRTATEVSAEERLSDRTRDKKINYWKAALRTFVVTWLDLEAKVYGNDKVKLQEPPEIRFPSESQQDPAELAQIASLMASSQSASIMTRVRSMHPEWDGTAVNAEVDRIKAELGVGMVEPDAATFNGIDDPMGAEEARELEERRKRELQEDGEA